MIKLMLYKFNGDKLNITDMVTDITWSGEENTLPRQLDFSIKNTNNVSFGRNLLDYEPGDAVIFYKDNNELFRGTIFKRSLSSNGDESVTCYDELIFATKNADTLLVKNKSASDVIISLCKKYGISVGSIQSTGWKIKKELFENQSLADIFMTCLEKTKESTGRSYKMFSSKGKVYLWGRSKATINTINITNVISGSNEVSIEEMATQVMITKGSLDSKDSKFLSHTEKDPKNIKRYGVMQKIETADEKDKLSAMRAKAKELLKQLNKKTVSANIEFIGDVSCISGRIIQISDPMSDISGKYYITSDSHSFSNGVHKMSLQLSKNLE